MSGLLKPVEHHDLDQTACMERCSGGVKADIAGKRFLRRTCVKFLQIGALMDKAALIKGR